MTRSTALTATDALFGFQKIIDATFFFPRCALDPHLLRQSLDDFTTANPAFAGRIKRQEQRGAFHSLAASLANALRPPLSPFVGWELRTGDNGHSIIPLTVLPYGGGGSDATGNRSEDTVWRVAAAAHRLRDGGAQFLRTLPPGEAPTCDRIMSGRSAVMGVTLTTWPTCATGRTHGRAHGRRGEGGYTYTGNDESRGAEGREGGDREDGGDGGRGGGGGSALGVWISHGVVDGHGFHLVVGEVARIYRSLERRRGGKESGHDESERSGARPGHEGGQGATGHSSDSLEAEQSPQQMEQMERKGRMEHGDG